MQSQFLKKYKLFFLLFFSLTFNIFSYSADTLRINYSCRNKEFPKVVEDLETIFNIRVYYDEKNLQEPFVNLDLINTSISETFLALTKEKPYIYLLIQKDLVVLITKEQYAYYTGQMVDLSGEPVDFTTTVIGDPSDIGKYDIAKIRGTVKDGSTGDVLIGATIQVENTTTGVSSDLYGNYSIDLKPGIYVLNTSSIGFEKTSFKIKVLGNGVFDMELYETTHDIDEVSIYATKADKNVHNSQMGMLELDAKEIKNLPGITGEKDLIKSMVTMPGIQSVGEFGSGINVRGGGEDQNLYLVEGAPLFNTSHVFGLMSVINPDAVSALKLYKGHVPANFGERASSVMDIEIKDNNINKYLLKGGVGIYNSRLMAEGPIGEKVSFKIAGRGNYSNWLLKRIKDYNLSKSSAGFYDLNALLDYGNKNTHISLFGYLSRDDFNYANELKYDYGNILASVNWKQAFNNVVSSELILSVSKYDATRSEIKEDAYAYSKYTDILYKSAKYGFTYTGIAKNEITAGIQAIEYNINPGERKAITPESLIQPITLEKENAYETGVYLNDVFEFTNTITINAGLRYSLFFYMGPGTYYMYGNDQALSELSIIDSVIYDENDVVKQYHNFEPRLSIVYSLENNNSIKLSYNRSSQYMSLISHTSISMPDHVWKLANYYFKPIRSNIYSTGYFQNFYNNTIESSVEIYYKDQKNLLEVKNDADLSLNPNLEREVIKAIGRNFGIELLVRKKGGKLQGSISYTYSRSLRKTDGLFKGETINSNNFFPSSYDKPNDLFIEAKYFVNKRLAISGSFTYATGRPINIPEYKFNYNGNYITYYTNRNKYRTPDYHRLDISVHLYESLRLKKKWKGNWTLTIMNIYGRKNAYSIFYKKDNPDLSNNFQLYSLYKVYLIGIPFPTLTYNFVF